MGERDEGREVPNMVRVSTADLDEQRLSMVLELYYRNAGRKREERERLERKRVRGREREREERKGESKRSEKARWGQTAPLKVYCYLFCC